jgi:Terminase DNA packaging enzyme
MHNSDDKKNHIANLLNVTPVVKENNLVIHQDTEKLSTEELDTDIKYIRDRMYETICTTADAVDEMLSIAKQSQHPRAFEVVATLLNTQREASKDLLDLHKKKKELKHEDQGGPDTVNNNLFVGSTADLLRMIKSNNE